MSGKFMEIHGNSRKFLEIHEIQKKYKQTKYKKNEIVHFDEIQQREVLKRHLKSVLGCHKMFIKCDIL